VFFAISRNLITSDNRLDMPTVFKVIRQKSKPTIPPSSPEAIAEFRRQEKERYEESDNPYVYEIEGVKSIVAPLRKGMK